MATVALVLGRARARVDVAAYDVLGRRVATLHAGPLAAGPHAFDLAGLAAGVYVVRASAEGLAFSRRLTLTR